MLDQDMKKQVLLWQMEGKKHGKSGKKSMESEVGKQKLFLSSLLSTSFSLQLVESSFLL